jgi:cell division septum initiation protein DivIVA
MTNKVLIAEEDILELIDALREQVAEIESAGGSPGEPPASPVRPPVAPGRGRPPLDSDDIEIPANNEILQVAQQRAEAILAAAEQQAEEVRSGADAYAVEVLGKVEAELGRLLTTVKRGKAALAPEDDVEMEAPPPVPPPSSRRPQVIAPQFLGRGNTPNRPSSPGGRDRLQR